MNKGILVDEDKIYQLADIAAAAQAQIQDTFSNLDPVVNISRAMRKSGFPADTMTIECLTSKKRILFIYHDDQPQQLKLQYGYSDQDPGEDYITMYLDEFTQANVASWIKAYFLKDRK
jgi:hypothetical protein